MRIEKKEEQLKNMRKWLGDPSFLALKSIIDEEIERIENNLIKQKVGDSVEKDIERRAYNQGMREAYKSISEIADLVESLLVDMAKPKP